MERGSASGASGGALEMRVAEPCEEALQVLERLVLHILCHSTLNTC